MSQLTVQATGVIVTAVWCLVATVIIVNLTKRLVGLRVDEEDEVEGLDYKAHGETGYKL